MTPTLEFASAEQVAMGILAPVAGVPVVQSTSAQLDPPLVRVRRVPGEPSDHLNDHAHIEVLTFGSTFAQAQDLGELCRTAIDYGYGKPVVLDDGRTVTVDATETISPPTEVPWANPDVRVFFATYRITTRRIPAL